MSPEKVLYNSGLDEAQRWAEEELRVAVRVLKLWRDPHQRFLRNPFKSALPDWLQDWPDQKTIERPDPVTNAEVDRYEEVVAVFERAVVNRRDRKLVWARAGGISWRRLRRNDGRSTASLQKVYRDALTRLARELR